jgi:hypothetical protein
LTVKQTTAADTERACTAREESLIESLTVVAFVANISVNTKSEPTVAEIDDTEGARSGISRASEAIIDILI